MIYHRTRNAYHESGHCVGAWSLKFPIRSVCIDLEGVEVQGRADIDLSGIGGFTFHLTRRQRQQTDRYIEMLLSGHAAFDLYCVRRFDCPPMDPADFRTMYIHGARSDVNRAVERILPTLARGETIETRIVAASRKARERLTRLWPAVEAVAHGLEQRGSLSGAEVRTLILESLPR